MANFLEFIELDDIKNDEQRALAQVIGIEAYIRLVKQYGGTNVYVLKEESLTKSIRDDKIKKEFNGRNYQFLAKKYNLTEQRIRVIINGSDEYEQIRFFEGSVYNNGK